MSEVYNIGDYKPAVIINDKAHKKTHVVERSTFEDIVKGHLKVEDLEGWKEILPIILGEWLDGYGGK